MSEVPKNIVIEESAWQQRNLDLLFGDEGVHHTSCQELPDLLVELGIYKSKSEARKAGRTGSIDTGWSIIKASKKRWLYIWNPSE